MARSNYGLKIGMLAGRRPMYARPARKKSLLADTPEGDRTARLCITDFYYTVLRDLQWNEPDLAPWIAGYVDSFLVGCEDFGGRITAVMNALERQRLNGNASRARWITRRILRDIGIEIDEADSKCAVVRKLDLSDQYLRRLIDAGDPELLKGAAAERARTFARTNRAALVRQAARDVDTSERGVGALESRAALASAALESAVEKRKSASRYATRTKHTANASLSAKATRGAIDATYKAIRAWEADRVSRAALLSAQSSLVKARERVIGAKASGRGGMVRITKEWWLMRNLRGPDADGSVWLVRSSPGGPRFSQMPTERYGAADLTPEGKASEIVRQYDLRQAPRASGTEALVRDFFRRRTYRSNRHSS